MSALGLSVVDADERTTEQVSIELTHETALVGDTRRELDELQGKRAEAIAAARAGEVGEIDAALGRIAIVLQIAEKAVERLTAELAECRVRARETAFAVARSRIQRRTMSAQQMLTERFAPAATDLAGILASLAETAREVEDLAACRT